MLRKEAELAQDCRHKGLGSWLSLRIGESIGFEEVCAALIMVQTLLGISCMMTKNTGASFLVMPTLGKQKQVDLYEFRPFRSTE